ncbi:382_t:CDS:10, partial [Acaulospora colombiana]
SYDASPDCKSYDIYGVIGLLELLSAIHLIVITERKNLGKIQGKDVYMVKRILVLPLDYKRACKILEKHQWPLDDEWDNTEGHQRYASNIIEEVEVPDSSQILSSTPESEATLDSSVISDSLPKKQPMSAFFSKVKSTFSELRRKRSPSISSNDSDSELDKDSEWETVPSDGGFSNEDFPKNSPDIFSFANGLSTAAKRMTGVFEGLGKDESSSKTISIKDPIDKKVLDARIARELTNLFQSDSFFFSYELVPLFWSQSPYGLKPRPILERSDRENSEAFSKHFDSILLNYGIVNCINLVETNGREAVIGSAYREELEKQNRDAIKYTEFDFHKECKGMKYENISNLISLLDQRFSAMKYFWKNCMDCLDRTNVVQSALAREVLNLQLLRLGLSEFIVDGISHYEQFENIFNEVWANNGDSISKEYAGTSALKGKRNLQGVVNDASNSIARLFQNNFKDFFRQALIDYLLGNHSIEVFQELQQKFEVSQPGDAERWAKVRATAIEISSSIVIVENEEKINGWTFLSPNEPNTLRGRSYEEKVLLLTKSALYVCTFHYKLEKVIQFKRIGLGEITYIEKGEYILSTLYPSCVSVEDNYGFVVHYRASGESSRINSGSMRNNNRKNEFNNNSSGEERFMAFKAFRSNIVGEATKFDGGGSGNNAGKGSSYKSSQLVVNEVVGEIVNACWAIGNAEEDEFLIERPIISLEEANKSTGIMTKVGFKVKQALWL